MASTFPNTPGTGVKVPFDTYIAGITESFPNVNRKRIIESSINSRERQDYLPSNMGLNQTVSDRYIEFRIPAVSGTFFDLNSIMLELGIRIKRGNDNIPADSFIGITNNFSNSIFKSVAVFLNDKMIESNPFYNYTSYIETLKNTPKSTISNIGRNGYLFDNFTEVSSTINDATFGTGSKMLELSNYIKDGLIYTYFPLNLDISSLDMYLLDNISIRIRLEMASDQWIMNVPNAGAELNIMSVNMAKLYIDKLFPHTNATLALYDSLKTSPIEYMFNKTLFKSFVIPAQQDSIMIDHPFTNCVPQKLTMALIDMRNYSGTYNRNGLYLDHFGLNGVHITINGSTKYNISPDFPYRISELYMETQKAIGNGYNNAISYDLFSKGYTIMCYDFISEQMPETVPVEISASMRISLKFSSVVPHSVVVLLFAETTGLLSIDSERNISCDVRG